MTGPRTRKFDKRSGLNVHLNRLRVRTNINGWPNTAFCKRLAVGGPHRTTEESNVNCKTDTISLPPWP
jgi:hypothetical protein